MEVTSSEAQRPIVPNIRRICVCSDRLTAGGYPSFLAAEAGLTRSIPDDVMAHLALRAILSFAAVSRPPNVGTSQD